MKRSWLVMLVVCACGGGGSSSEVALADLPERLREAFCGLQVRCGLSPDQATCLESNDMSSVGFETLLSEASSPEGTVTYHPERAGDCVAAIESRDCDITGLFTLLIEQCTAAFEPKVTDGGDCFFDEQCLSGACEEIEEPACTEETCCPGTCATVPALAGIDADCSVADCAPEAFCQRRETGFVCTARVAAGGTCTGFNDCVEGTSCRDYDQATGEGKCGVSPATGEACDEETFTGCDDLRDICDSGTGLCTRRAAAGATCDPVQNNCVLLADCVEGICVAKPSLGDSCATQSCLGTLQCLGDICGPGPVDQACAE
jgi:hypothetical protein